MVDESFSKHLLSGDLKMRRFLINEDEASCIMREVKSRVMMKVEIDGARYVV